MSSGGRNVYKFSVGESGTLWKQIIMMHAKQCDNSGTTLWNLRKVGKEKRMHIIRCECRGYKDVYWKLLKNKVKR
jgi:hypothetical protein